MRWRRLLTVDEALALVAAVGWLLGALSGWLARR